MHTTESAYYGALGLAYRFDFGLGVNAGYQVIAGNHFESKRINVGYSFHF